jgi:hypothetical protein
MASTVEISVIDNVIAEAERCRREAISVVGNDARYSELIGQPSSWCIVTEKGLWSRTFHRVVLTVGLVGHPNIPLHASKYASVVSVGEAGKHSKDRLADIAVRAKIRAASILHA